MEPSRRERSPRPSRHRRGCFSMIPNMYKIAGELTPFAMHVAARTLATHALSIFGDHSDVMACRQTGFALLASGSVQEAQDLAAIAHAATLSSRIPFLHFFDGFRTSHEVAKIVELSDEELSSLLDPEDVAAHRRRALTPDRPVLRGTAQNPDTFFQAREAGNPFYLACPDAVARAMERFGEGHGQELPPLRLRRRPGGDPRPRADGLRGRHGARDRRVALRTGREGRSPEGPALSPVRRRALRRRAAVDRPGHRRPRSHQGAGSRRRAALPGRRHGALRVERGPCTAASRRRALRALLQGVHAGDGRRRLRRAFARDAEEPLHHRHHRRRDGHFAALGCLARHRAAGHDARACLLRPGRRRNRRSQPQLDQDPRRGDRGLRPGLFRLRLEEGGSDDRLAPAFRAAAHPVRVSHRPGALRGLPPVRVRQPLRHARARPSGRGLPAERP